MIDLASLISSDSGISVGAGAFDINDRGEIAGRGIDANGNKHAILLIPCDENHPDVEGCDYSLVNANTAAEISSQQAVQSSTESKGNDRPIGWRERLDGRLVHHHGFSDSRSPNN